MKIFVTAKPNSKNAGVEKIDPPSPKGLGRTGEMYLIVSVKEPPREGKANYAIFKALAEYLTVPLSNIRLTSGATSRQKVFEIF